MKRNRVHVWEWAVWLISILLVLYAALTTFSVGNLGAGILLCVGIALILCGVIYRIDHPEKYDQIMERLHGSMQGTLVGGLPSVRPGKAFSLTLERDELILSDEHREKYSLLLSNIIDAEALSRRETQVWKGKPQEQDSGRRVPSRPSFWDKIKAQWGKWFDRYLVINYRDRSTGAVRAIIFCYWGDRKGKGFAEELKYRAALGGTASL